MDLIKRQLVYEIWHESSGLNGEMVYCRSKSGGTDLMMLWSQKSYLNLINTDCSGPTQRGAKERSIVKINELSSSVIFIKRSALAPTALCYLLREILPWVPALLPALIYNLLFIM